MSKKKRLIKAKDLYRFQLATYAELSPDGRQVVYALQRVDAKSQKTYANLWIAPVVGGEPWQLTVGDHVDSLPRWSPDGSRIAFLSNRDAEKQPQIYLIRFGGGEAQQLTDLKGEFAEVSWSPDGEALAFQFRKKDQDAIERETEDKKKELGIVAREIDRVRYSLDGKGYLPKERWHIWTVDAQSGKATQLTDHAIYDELRPCWAPDGKALAFVSNHAQDPDLDPDRQDLFVMPAGGGKARKLPAPPGPKPLHSWSPDGKWIAYVGQEGCGLWYKNEHLWIVRADGKEDARNLTARHDFTISAFTLNDTGSAKLMPPVWSKDGKRLYVQVSEHGSTTLRVVSVKHGNVEPVIEEQGVVGCFNFDAEQQTLFYFHGKLQDPVQLWVLDMASGATRQLTQLNAWLDEVDLGEVEEVWTKGPDNNHLQGWILKPPRFDPEKSYPSILEIHGGPLGQYGFYFMHEFYYLAAQGYIVHFTNPRGGIGYGETHAGAIWGGWGDRDYADLMAWTDYIAKLPYIDPARMGVTGGSYGGYMTAWIIGHTGRFAAAVTQRCVSNLISMWGSSDGNWVFQLPFGNQAPYQSIERLWESSPMKYIGNAKTPTLVIHSQNDLRCPIEQGQQVYVALKTLGVDTGFIVFPDEPHGLSRVGRTDRRVARLQHIRRWFDRYLKADRD
ncbi:MAG: S9 family peptidase [Anaerolineae bacterium]|nr:S9 family peptidase [Anaerolineae bacterium]